jgi:hypothetical protein
VFDDTRKLVLITRCDSGSVLRKTDRGTGGDINIRYEYVPKEEVVEVN